MSYALVSHAPITLWVLVALTLVVPFHLPRFGLAVGALGSIAGALLCLHVEADAFAVRFAHQVGTAVLLGAGLWLLAACAGLVRLVRAQSLTA